MGRPPIGKRAMSGAERVRRYRLNRAADKPVPRADDGAALQQARARVATLEAEVSALKAQLAREQQAMTATVTELRRELNVTKTHLSITEAVLRDKERASATKAAQPDDDLKAALLGLRPAPKPPPKPKVVKPPLPPDEVRDREIKGLKTRVRNLNFELHSMRQWDREQQSKKGTMDFATVSAISKCLHPEHTSTEEEQAKAIRLFNAWKGDNRKAGRRA
jgi:hypothetical protein